MTQVIEIGEVISKNWPNHEIDNYFVFIGKKIELKLFPN